MKVVKICRAEFVVDISELGEKDPLMQNATRSFESLKVPWYTTTALDRQGSDYFLKRVKTPHGAAFDLIALNTGSLQNAYLSGQACARLDRGLGFTPINQRLVSHREKGTGFLLHRVSSLEMVTYFISLTGGNCAQNCTPTTGVSPWFFDLSSLWRNSPSENGKETKEDEE
ncbi:hypothetical protein RHGRI_009168 [Rhododendron griersonianum]|uniref:Uncharacterized protein n=1 Tax=Rhododendron griersonianum TaxID=479676 RepID=A0AAV6L355_9ERIC|nr:hypothetical protein RHGRI_009168 [Rhododendron griersonianum]